jgi:Pyridoxamine 5'-phosphate oxidase
VIHQVVSGMMMRIEGQVSEVLARTRVVEFATITPKGTLSTRPMRKLWLPERDQIILTTPPAFPQKIYNVRRDGRVAVLFSDPTGTGLTDPPAVLVQGRAIAPHTVVLPEEIPDYWRELFDGFSWPSVQELESEQFQRTMDWYFWRLAVYVTPERVRVLPGCEAGGAAESPLPQPSAPLAVRVRDALERYPTGVLTGRDDDGWPCAVRVTITAATDGNSYLVKPVESVPVASGPASLLWHRQGAPLTRQLSEQRVRWGEWSELLVFGAVSTGRGQFVFTPERVFTGAFRRGVTRDSGWSGRYRNTALDYLRRHNIDPPQINWQSLVNYATPQ